MSSTTCESAGLQPGSTSLTRTSLTISSPLLQDSLTPTPGLTENLVLKLTFLIRNILAMKIETGYCCYGVKLPDIQVYYIMRMSYISQLLITNELTNKNGRSKVVYPI